MPIIEIEMHLRDGYTLNWLKQRLENGPDTVTYFELADALNCHPNTARAVLKRLLGAGLIEVQQDGHPGRGGYTYRISERED